MHGLLLIWQLWLGPFSGMPYGDPYLAGTALALIITAVGRLLRAVFG